MRKLFSLFMAVMLLCLPAFAWAEGESYADPDGRFTFPCPEGWTVLSKETIEDVLKVAETVQDEQFQQMVESVKPQIEQMGIIILMSADYTCNINVVCQDDVDGVNGEVLLSLGDTLKSQLSAQFEDFVLEEEPELYEVGSWEPMMFAYEYSIVGIDMAGAQAYLPKDNSLMIFTLTAQKPQVEQGVSALMQVLLGLE